MSLSSRKGFRRLEKKQVSRPGGPQTTINREGLISIGKKLMTQLVGGGVEDGCYVDIESDDKDTLCIIFDCSDEYSGDRNNPKLRITKGSGKISGKSRLGDSNISSITDLLESDKGTESITVIPEPKDITKNELYVTVPV